MKCLNFKPYDSGCLKGFATIEFQVEGKTAKMSSCKLFEKEDSSWIAVNGIKGTDKEGNECYFPAFSFLSREDKQAFSDMAVDAITLWRQENAESDVKKTFADSNLKQKDIFDDSDSPF